MDSPNSVFHTPDIKNITSVHVNVVCPAQCEWTSVGPFTYEILKLQVVELYLCDSNKYIFVEGELKV